MKKVPWYILSITAVAVFGAFLGLATYNQWSWEYIRRVAYTKSSILYTRYSCATANAVLSGHRNCEVQMGRAEYRALHVKLRLGPGDYNAFGDYLNYGGKYWDDGKFDGDGVPLLRVGGAYSYNPVLTANYALSMYDRALQGDKSASAKFIKATERLLALQDKSGAFRYQYRWKYYLSGKEFQPGWVSGMAQGVGLSVLVRAYHLTSDPRYLAAGNRALDFLLVPVSQGGTTDSLADLDPSLGTYLFYDEFPATPSGYTLNGFMVAVLGLYDWSQLPGDHQANAARHFQEGIRTLKRILPYYDLGGFTTYDLGHVTYHRRPKLAAEYHAVHIELLWALSDVTHDAELRRYQELWTSYIAG